MALQVVFRSTKTQQTLFATHDPFVVTSANTHLMEAFRHFDDKVGFLRDSVVFRQAPLDPTPLSRAWFAAVVRQAAPTATPHSCRVGCATELWAAGATIDDIMAVGRWRSHAATLYVLGSVQQQVGATDRLRDGGLAYTKIGLQTAMSTLGERNQLPTACPTQWSTIAARTSPWEE